MNLQGHFFVRPVTSLGLFSVLSHSHISLSLRHLGIKSINQLIARKMILLWWFKLCCTVIMVWGYGFQWLGAYRWWSFRWWRFDWGLLSYLVATFCFRWRRRRLPDVWWGRFVFRSSMVWRRLLTDIRILPGRFCLSLTRRPLLLVTRRTLLLVTRWSLLLVSRRSSLCGNRWMNIV